MIWAVSSDFTPKTTQFTMVNSLIIKGSMKCDWNRSLVNTIKTTRIQLVVDSMLTICFSELCIGNLYHLMFAQQQINKTI